jgi:hypothetical protein
MTDSTGDMFDKSRNRVSGEAYMDIIEAEIQTFETYYAVQIMINEPLPAPSDNVPLPNGTLSSSPAPVSVLPGLRLCFSTI